MITHETLTLSEQLDDLSLRANNDNDAELIADAAHQLRKLFFDERALRAQHEQLRTELTRLLIDIASLQRALEVIHQPERKVIAA
jgi:hypothetical protein